MPELCVITIKIDCFSGEFKHIVKMTVIAIERRKYVYLFITDIYN